MGALWSVIRSSLVRRSATSADLLNHHRMAEYGDPEVADEFAPILKISPLHSQSNSHVHSSTRPMMLTPLLLPICRRDGLARLPGFLLHHRRARLPGHPRTLPQDGRHAPGYVFRKDYSTGALSRTDQPALFQNASAPMLPRSCAGCTRTRGTGWARRPISLSRRTVRSSRSWRLQWGSSGVGD